MIAPARLSPGDDDSAIATKAARQTALGDVASMVEQGLSLDAAAAAMDIAVPDPATLPAHFAFAPSPQHIAAECQVTQVRWSNADRRQRQVMADSPPWEPPSIAVADLGAA